MPNKLDKKYLPVVGIVVFVIFFYFAFGQSGSSSSSVNKTAVTNGTSPASDGLPINPNTQNIQLVDVAGGDSKGDAMVLRHEGTLFHAVQANLPELEDGQVYEGWLVQKTPLDFFSTGVMTQEEANTFILVYENLEGDFPNHNQVVITLETIVDETPEKHILEGSFR